MRRSPLIAPFVAVLLLAGCGSDVSDVASPATAIPAASGGSWESQIAAVRAGQSDAIRLDEHGITPEQFQQLGQGCESLTTLLIDEGEIGDTELSVLSRLPKLRQLKLPGSVGDVGLEAISDCRGLELLNLPGGDFSDRGCAQLAQLDQLMLLRFGSPHVTDEGIRSLTRLPGLRFLHLLDVPITNAALDRIASIKTLESFYLDGGRASDDGLRRLIVQRPDLHVHLDQTHIPGDPNAHD